MMALASSSTLGLQVHQPTKTPSPALPSQTTHLPEPHHDSHHPKATSTINLPTSLLSNLLNLHLISTPHLNPPPQHPSPTFSLSISPKEDISSLHTQLHGPTDWSPLLAPLHPWLRREIIKYGEFAQATYDAFDFNPLSPFCGSCLFARHHLFTRLPHLARHAYTPTKYLYATSHVSLPRWLQRSLHADSWSNDSNWMGYVAVSDDDESRRLGGRDIVVAWRGTVAPSEWLEDLQGKLEPLGPSHGDARVEHGFLSLYTSKNSASRYNKSSASEQVIQELKRLVSFYKEKGEEVSITITGHSLGGALALLNAYEAAVEIPGVPISVISFGAPRVGNEAFGERLEGAGVKALRVAVKQDLVPKMPGVLFNEGMKRVKKEAMGWVYTHVGVELGLDVRESPYLKGAVDLAGFHSLETYLHLVDGYVREGEGYRREAKRDPALVNKATGLLREELHVPVCWNQPANKGLVCNAYGRWVQPHRDEEDIPSPYREGPAASCLR